MTIATFTKKSLAALMAGSALLISGCGVFNKELRTEIVIDSTPEKVWSALMDFEQFPNWNPMIRRASGNAVTGEKLDVFIQPEGARGMAFNPTVIKVEENREFRWLGVVGMRGIFDGEHVFSIEPMSDDSVLFVHREEFSGVMIPVMMPFIGEDTLRGFNDMNGALKKLVESSS